MVPWKLHDFKPRKMSLDVPWKRFRKWFAKFCGYDLEAREMSIGDTIGDTIDKNKTLKTILNPYVAKSPKTRGIRMNIKSVWYAKQKYSVQFYNKVSVQLLRTRLNVLLKTIEFFSEQCSRKKLLKLFMTIIVALNSQ